MKNEKRGVEGREGGSEDDGRDAATFNVDQEKVKVHV